MTGFGGLNVNLCGLSSSLSVSELEKKIIDVDKQFLLLINSIRNSTHYNAVPLSSKSFKTRLGKYSLHAGVPISFLSEDLLLKMIKELVEIYYNIVLCFQSFEGIVWETASSQSVKILVENNMAMLPTTISTSKVFKIFLKCPRITIGALIEQTGYSRTTVSKALKKLIELGFIIESAEGKKEKVFVYQTYVDLINFKK